MKLVWFVEVKMIDKRFGEWVWSTQSEWVSVWVSDWVSEWVSDWVSDWVSWFVYLLLNGTSALFRPLVPRIAEGEHMRYVKNDL